MTAAWALVVLLVVFSTVMLAWNLFLMQILDIAKGDVRRLSQLLHPSSPTLSLLEPRDGAP